MADTQETGKAAEEGVCYLCGNGTLKSVENSRRLQCEKGAPIIVCEDCYEAAEGYENDW